MKQPEYKNGRIPAFTMKRYTQDGRWISAARFQCTRCPNHIDFPVHGAPEPNHMARLAGDKKWEVSAWTASSVRCPTCKTIKAKGESPNDDQKETTKVVTLTPKEPAAAPVEKLPREPTTDERHRIRGLLDANFDDKAGQYLADYSDRRIGEEVGVPWAIVAKIREVGYGPIRVDPEIDRLRAMIATVEKSITTLQAGLDAASGHVEDLRKRLAAIEAKRAA